MILLVLLVIWQLVVNLMAELLVQEAEVLCLSIVQGGAALNNLCRPGLPLAAAISLPGLFTWECGKWGL